MVIYPFSLSNSLVKEACFKLEFKLLLTKEVKKVTITIGKKHLKGIMSLKMDYCRKHCAMLNSEETNKVEMIEKIAERMIDLSLKFDEQLRTTVRNDFEEEE